MKTLISYAALAAALTVAQPASAQSFAGPYVGGYIAANSTSVPSVDVDCEVDCDTITLKKTRIAGGLTAGFNAQVDKNFVVGIEGDLGTGGKDSSIINDDYTYYNAYQLVTARQKWIGTVRARAGLVLENTMVYATAGLAVTKARFSNGYFYRNNCTNCDYRASTSETMTGLALGGGIEHSFGVFSVKAEILHLDFGSSKRACFADTTGSSAGQCFDDNNTAGFSVAQFYPTTNSARIGFNYRF